MATEFKLTPLSVDFFELRTNIYSNAQLIMKKLDYLSQNLLANGAINKSFMCTITAPPTDDRDCYLWLQKVLQLLICQVNKLISWLVMKRMNYLNNGDIIMQIDLIMPIGLVIDQIYCDRINNLWIAVELRLNQANQILTTNGLLS